MAFGAFATRSSVRSNNEIRTLSTFSKFATWLASTNRSIDPSGVRLVVPKATLSSPYVTCMFSTPGTSGKQVVAEVQGAQVFVVAFSVQGEGGVSSVQ